jgi:putative oxidoreductase
MDKLARLALAPLLLRLGLAVVFIFHGMQKLLPDQSWGVGWNPGLHVAVQAAVAWGEFLGGVALAIGFLTRLAALGIVAIMVGAIVTVHGQHGFALANKGYEYNFVLIVMALAVALLGSGVLGLDRLLFPPRDDRPKGA